MKKMSWGLYGVGVAMLLTSCVAKKKYVEAQNNISRLQQQNAECMQRGDSLGRTLGSLQETNTALQRRYDSSYTAYNAQQTRWNDYTGFYEKQHTTADQLHTQLHQQLDDKIGAMNIVLDNNKVYITLPEATLFAPGSTSLSAKGKDIVNTVAVAVAAHPDVEVNVATTPVYTGNSTAYNNNNAGVNNQGVTENDEATTNDQSVASEKTTTKKTKTYSKNANTAGNGNYAENGAVKHKTKMHHAPSGAGNNNYNNATAKTSTGTKHKSETTRKTMRSNYASKRMSNSSSSSSMAVARASTIVTAMRQQGVQKAGIQVTDPTNKSVTTARKYQVIVSPSMDGYYQMMGKNNMGTGMK